MWTVATPVLHIIVASTQLKNHVLDILRGLHIPKFDLSHPGVFDRFPRAHFEVAASRDKCFAVGRERQILNLVARRTGF